MEPRQAVPTYAELLNRKDAPSGSSWGIWGADDALGALNLLTAERVRAAMGLVKKGSLFSLNWDLQLPKPAFGNRGKPRHHYFTRDPWGRDDVVDNLYLHGSSHWDSFCHFAYPDIGYYNGVQPITQSFDGFLGFFLGRALAIATCAASRSGSASTKTSPGALSCLLPLLAVVRYPEFVALTTAKAGFENLI